MSSIVDIINEAVKARKSVKILYSKFDGELSERIISEISYSVDILPESHVREYKLNADDHITAFCQLRQETRTFYIQRIITAKILI